MSGLDEALALIVLAGNERSAQAKHDQERFDMERRAYAKQLRELVEDLSYVPTRDREAMEAVIRKLDALAQRIDRDANSAALTEHYEALEWANRNGGQANEP